MLGHHQRPLSQPQHYQFCRRAFKFANTPSRYGHADATVELMSAYYLEKGTDVTTNLTMAIAYKTALFPGLSYIGSENRNSR